MFKEGDYFISWDGEVDEFGGIIQYSNGLGKSCERAYSDRLYSWYGKKYNEVCKEIWGNIGQYFYGDRTPEDVEKFLRKLLDNENITLVRIVRYENKSDGFPYWGFDFNR